jgi:uncharacterized protein YqhQ
MANPASAGRRSPTTTVCTGSSSYRKPTTKAPIPIVVFTFFLENSSLNGRKALNFSAKYSDVKVKPARILAKIDRK